MGKIAASTLRDWNDGETVNATDYKQEREIIRTAINDTHDRYLVDEATVQEELTRLAAYGYKGVYDETTTYGVNAFVRYNSGLWIALQETTGNEPIEGDYWEALLDFSSVITDAEQSTEDANTAETNATNQGNIAESQGLYANEQGDYAKNQGDSVQDIIDGEGVQGIHQGDTEPEYVIEGRFWVDTSDNTYQGTVFQDLDDRKAEQSYVEENFDEVNEGLAKTKKKQDNKSYDLKEDLGAVGDGVTDDTDEILEGLSLISDGGVLYVPKGEYLYTQPIIINSGMVVEGHSNTTSTLLYDGVGSGVDIDTEGTLNTVTIKKKSAWDMSNQMSGVRLLGSQGRGNDITIIGFEKGLHLIGIDKGCAYNQVFLRRIYNCVKGIHTDSTGNGWVNENTVYAGRISIESELHSTDIWNNDSWGIYIDFNGNNRANNNKFISPSIESVGKGIRIVGLYNSFYHPRIENVGGVKLLFEDRDGISKYNYIFGAYGTLEQGTEVIFKDENGVELDYNPGNFIHARKSPTTLSNSSLQMHEDGYRKVFMNYNLDNDRVEFERDGGIIFSVGDDAYDFKGISVNGFRLPIFTTTNRPSNPSKGFVVFDLDLDKQITYTSRGWVDGTDTVV